MEQDLNSGSQRFFYNQAIPVAASLYLRAVHF